VTTSVMIRSPAPNHQNVMVQLQVVGADGAWHDQGEPRRLNDGESLAEHLYGGRRLVLTEAARQA